MNKIRIVNNEIIPFDSSNDLKIYNNEITFLNNGNYYIEYIDSDNITITINVLENVCIHLFEYSTCLDVVINNIYNLNKNSSLILNKFYANNSTIESISINLNGEKANIKYNFSSISSNDDKYSINIYHLEKNTSSDIFNRTVAKNNSSNTFDINSFVENGIKDCFLNQQTKIITLGDSNNRINPNMFIGENGTTAVHSSTIGSIDRENLFYLMSRGIYYKEAVNLIIKGMIVSNINPDMETKEKILNILEKIGGE